MRNYFVLTYLFILLPILFCTDAIGDEDTVTISIDKDAISLSGSVRLDVTFAGVEDMDVPAPPQIDNFESTYLRSSNIVSKVGAKMLRSKRHTYVLMPKVTGLFTIGPLDFSHKGNSYRSNQLKLEVRSGAVAYDDVKGRSSSEERFRAQERAFLLIETEKDRVYINERFPISVNLYYKKGTHLSDIQLPLILHDGFSMGEFGSPSKTRKTIKAHEYVVISFRNSIFAVRTGEMKFGPATLNCNLRMSKSDGLSSAKDYEGVLNKIKEGGIFQKDLFKDMDEAYQKRPFRLESTPKSITVLPMPKKGRPNNFSGAVGDFSLSLKVEPSGVIHVGEPLVLYMKISGKGNLAIAAPPRLKKDASFVLYEPVLKEEKQNYKVFEQTLVPNTAAFKNTPEIEFAFFDPKNKIYRIVTEAPVPVKVIEAYEARGEGVIEKQKEVKPKSSAEPVGRDIIYIKDKPGRVRGVGVCLYKNRRFLSVQIWPLLLYVGILTWYRRYERLKNDIRYARAKFAYKKAKKGLGDTRAYLNVDRAEEFYEHLFGVLQEYFGDKFGVPPGGITVDFVDDVLEPHGFNPKFLERIKLFFKNCDIARFTKSDHQKKDMAGIFAEAERIVESLKGLKV